MQYLEAVRDVMASPIIEDMVRDGEVAGPPTVGNLLPHAIVCHEQAMQELRSLGDVLRAGSWEDAKDYLDAFQGTFECLSVLVNARDTLARAVLTDAVALGMPTIADFTAWSAHSIRESV